MEGSRIAWISLFVVFVIALMAASAAADSAPPSGWDGTNPYSCELQQAGTGTAVPHPEADPYCVEFDKTHQNVTELGVVDFLSKEPARVAAAVDKCFYFQSDHWRGSVVQDDPTSKTYEFDGHYFFNKATGDGGAWVTNFNINGHTFDPSEIPGIPPAYSQYLGPGTGGVITHDDVPADPMCVAAAGAPGPSIYAPPSASKCRAASGVVTATSLGGVTLGDAEPRVRTLLGEPALVKRGFLRYCLDGGGKELVGVPGDRSGTGPADPSAHAVLLLTTNAAYRFGGIGRGARGSAARRAFPHAHSLFVLGRTHYTRVTRTVFLGIRLGRVRSLAVYDPKAIRTQHALREWLRRSA